MKLLRATPWFEMYLTEGPDGYRLHRRYGGVPEQVSPNYIDRIDREGDWLTFHEYFDTEELLQKFVESKVPKRMTNLSELPASLALARGVLSGLKTVDKLPPHFRVFIESLLESPTLDQEPEVREELRRLLTR